MATNYPANFDTFVNPAGTDQLDNPPHASQHDNANDSIEALQVKVGKDGDTNTESHDYKIATLETSVASKEDKSIFQTEHNSDGTHTPQAITTAIYVEDAGADDAYEGTLTGLTSLIAGLTVKLKVSTANTGACTFDLNGLGAKSIKKIGGSGLVDLDDGDIASGEIVELVYDGAQWQAQIADKPYIISLAMSADQSVPDNTETLLNLDTIDFSVGADTSDFSASSHEWTCPKTGYYKINAQARHFSGIWNTYSTTIRIRKNGAEIMFHDVFDSDGKDPIHSVSVARIVHLNQGDVIKMYGTIDINTGIDSTQGKFLHYSTATFLQITRIRL